MRVSRPLLFPVLPVCSSVGHCYRLRAGSSNRPSVTALTLPPPAPVGSFESRNTTFPLSISRDVEAQTDLTLQRC